MTPAQCRAGRRLIGLTRDRLAASSGVPIGVISNFEVRGYVQRSHAGIPQEERFKAIRATLEAAGVEFIQENGGGAGVRLRKSA